MSAESSGSSGLEIDTFIRQAAINEFQQRLVLLNHASKCTETVHCAISPRCLEMQTLWKHINSCADDCCTFPHCVSTRYLYSHSTSCTNQGCIICKPLKESIQRVEKRKHQTVSFVPKKKSSITTTDTREYADSERERTESGETETSVNSNSDISTTGEAQAQEEREIEQSTNTITLRKTVSFGTLHTSPSLSNIERDVFQLLEDMHEQDHGNQSLNTINNNSINNNNNKQVRSFDKLQRHHIAMRQKETVIFRSVPDYHRTLMSFMMSIDRAPQILNRFTCRGCREVIRSSHRYSCEECNHHLCYECFHDDSDERGQKHSHPMRAIKIQK